MHSVDGGNIQAVSDPTKADESSVEAAAPLIAFANAVIQADAPAIESSRRELHESIGAAGVVDAAAVIGNFQRMNRIADAAGAVVDPPVRILTANLRDELGLDRLASATDVEPAGFLSKTIAKIAIPLAAKLYRKKS